jgi:hypothetical protein
MKAFVCSMLVLSLFVASTWGQAETIVRERAKKLVNQNNARQGVPPPMPPAPAPVQPIAPPPNPALNATLQNIAELQNDLSVLETNATIKTQLVANLNAAAQGTKPSAGSISKLADDLTTGLSGKKLSQDQRHKLAQFCHAIANGSHLSATQEQAVFDGVTKSLESAGVAPGDIAKIVADMKVIVGETK